MDTFADNLDSYNDSYASRRRRKRIVRLGLSAVALVVVAIGAWLAVSYAARSGPVGKPKVADRKVLLAAWESRDYETVNKLATDSLEAEPLDPMFLTFRGFSSFYLGARESDLEARSVWMDSAVSALRKAKAAGSRGQAALKVDYVLGKAYYFKGPDYMDAARIALESAYKGGFRASDLSEYLALVYGANGMHKESLAFFEAAMLENPGSDSIVLAAAKAYLDSGDKLKSLALAEAALAMTKDLFIAERCRFILAEIAQDEKNWEKALAEYGAILEVNDESADAWFQTGMVYGETGDLLKARAAWRKAVSIDPMHAGARQKLSERQ